MTLKMSKQKTDIAQVGAIHPTPIDDHAVLDSLGLAPSAKSTEFFDFNTAEPQELDQFDGEGGASL